MTEFNNRNILIYENRLSNIYKTIDQLKRTFNNFHIAKNEEEYFNIIKEITFDVILLNLDVAPLDGIAVIKETINFYSTNRPYFILYSSKQDDFLAELAYNNGTDIFYANYTNPILTELIIKSLLKRIHSNNSKTLLAKEFFINEEEYIVENNNNKLTLPKKEFKILQLLNQNHNKFYSKEELALIIWKDETIAKKRTIDVHIYNIRQIFGKKVIQTQKGKGYRINKKYFS